MSRLSIVIPFLGNSKLLEETLVSVLENRPKQSEVLVVLGRPYDDPYHLDDEVRFIRAPRRTGLAGCLNLGIGTSRADVVHVLGCGAEVTEGWTAKAVGHFQDRRVACVAPLVMSGQDPDRVIAAGIDYHPGGTMQLLRATTAVAEVPEESAPVLAPHSAAAFYRKSAFQRTGRFQSETGDRLTTLDMALLLERAGYRTVLEPRCRVRLARAASDNAGAFRCALDAERFFWRWGYAGGWSRSLALHALCLAAEAGGRLLSPSMVPWLAGRMVGSLSIGCHRRCRARLEQAVRANPALDAPHFATQRAKPTRKPRAATG